MEKRVTLVFAALLVGSTVTPAAAQVSTIESSTSTHWQAPSRTGKISNPNKIVCEMFETTGTRLGLRKVCKTKLEWQQMQLEQRQTLEKVQQQGTGVPTSG